MIVREWLRTRTPAAPDRLLARVEATLGPRCERDSADSSALCLDAAEELLRTLLARTSVGRESALDLLTVDALVTYAFEAASDSPGDVPHRASEAMRRLGATAAA